jgi:hypothetical protein
MELTEVTERKGCSDEDAVTAVQKYIQNTLGSSPTTCHAGRWPYTASEENDTDGTDEKNHRVDCHGTLFFV